MAAYESDPGWQFLRQSAEAAMAVVFFAPYSFEYFRDNETTALYYPRP